MQKPDSKTLAANKGATFNYDIKEEFTAGLILTGSEIKSLRQGGGVLRGSWIKAEPTGLYLQKFQIKPYKYAPPLAHDPYHPRQLLLRKSEHELIQRKIKESGLILIPLKIFLSGPWAKIRLALAQARKKHDKRQIIKEREAKLRTARALRGR